MPDDATTHLSLPFIAAAQAQKHITHNEALRLLDVLVQLAVLDRDLSDPPGSPEEGDSYVVATGGSGAWTGKDGQVAAWLDDGWTFLEPHAGWLAFAVDEAALIFFDGTGWTAFSGIPSELQNLPLLGLGTTADSTNPFSAKLNKALWTALYSADGGSGDLFYTMNKELATDDLGLMLQQDFVTKALIGLYGSNKFRLAVSDDGSSFFTAVEIDNTNGAVDFPNLPRFIGFINFDQYIPNDAWTKAPINSVEYNDQNAFSGSTNRFTAPVDGTYAFGATLGWKQNNTNVPTVTKAKFVKNGGGTPVDLSAPLVSRPLSGVAAAGTEIVLTPQIMCQLSAGDTVELQQLFVALDGYIPSMVTRFWGCKIG